MLKKLAWVTIATAMVLGGGKVGIAADLVYDSSTPTVNETEPGLPATGLTIDNWNDAADAHVFVNGTAGDATVTVNGLGTSNRTVNSITITGDAGGSAELVFDTGTTYNTTAGTVDISGVVGKSGTLTVTNSSTVNATGQTTLGDYSNLTVEANSRYNANGGILMDSASGINAQIDVTGGTLAVTGALQVNNGIVNVSGGNLDLGTQSFSLGYYGTHHGTSELNVTGTGTLTATGNSVVGQGTVTLDTTGAVKLGTLALDNANANVNVANVANTSTANFVVTQGALNITGADVEFAGGSSVAVNGGNFTIAGSSTLTIDSVNASGGVSDISGTLKAATVATSGTSQFNVSGHLETTGAFQADGGAITISGTVAAATFNAAGAAVTITGTIADATDFNISGGKVTVDAGGKFGDATTGLASLAMSGTGVLELNGDAKVQRFSASGGTVDLAAGTFTTDSTPGSLQSQMNIHDTAVWAVGSDAAFSGGGIKSFADSAAVQMAGSTLTIGPNATLDAEDYQLNIYADTLYLNGNYNVGFNGADVTMATVRQTGGAGGQFHIGNDVQIGLSSTLQRHIANFDFLGGDTLLVLQGESTTGTQQYVEYDNGINVYQYRTGQNAAGQWGLYLTGTQEYSDEERYRNLLDRWNAISPVDGHADKVINPGFGNAVRSAGDILLGRAPYDPDTYTNLDENGQFNVMALHALADRSVATASYSALMLYNGGGVTQINQAIMDMASLIRRKLDGRTAFVRNEMYAANETVGADRALASMDPERLDKRLWASLIWANDSVGKGKGFAGYDYRPYGLLVGYDQLFGDSLTLGLAAGYADGTYEDKAAISNNSKIENYMINIYGAYNHCSGIFITGSLGYAYSDNNIRDVRMIHGFGLGGTEMDLVGTNKADHSADTWMAALKIGYDYRPIEYLTISPSIGLAYTNTTNAAHSQVFTAEHGFAANTINTGRITNHSTAMPLEVAVSYDWYADDERLLTLTGNIGYTLEFHDKGAGGTVSYGGLGGLVAPVQAASRKPGRHALTLGAGMKYAYRQYELGFAYDYAGRSNYNSHTLTGSFGLNF